MTLHTITQIDPDILTVAGLFSADECAHWIAQGEGLGFETASVSLEPVMNIWLIYCY